MNRIATILGVVTVALATSGCAVLRVREGSTDVGGIPFYVKKTVVNQKTSWREDLYEATITEREVAIDPALDPGLTRTVVASRIVFEETIRPAQLASPKMNDLRTALGNYPTHGLGPILQAASRLAESTQERSCVSADGRLVIPGACFVLVGNRLTSSVIVDTTKIYFLNARHPLVGRGSLEFELAADQTITKGKAEIEDSTLATVLGLLPVREYLSARHVPAQQPKTVKGLQIARETIYEVELKLTPRPLLHHFQKEATTVGAPITSLDHGVEYWVEAAGGGSSSEASRP